MESEHSLAAKGDAPRLDEVPPRERPPLALVELALMVLLVCLLVVLSLPMVRAAAAGGRKSNCAANLKQLGLALKMFAGESRGQWAPVSPVPGNWVPDMDLLYPDYCSDLSLFICPGHPDARRHRFQYTRAASRRDGKGSGPRCECVSSRYYVYTGFVIGDDYDAIALHDALLGGDWELLRTGDLQSPVPYALDMLGGPAGSGAVMWDRLVLAPSQVAHRPLGVNVLFMDGHVEFLAFDPDDPHPTFPATTVSAELFGPLSPDLPSDCAS